MNRINRFSLAAIAIAASLGASARKPSINDVPRISIQWISDSGKLEPLDWSYAASWKWSPAQVSKKKGARVDYPFPYPSYRVWLAFPDNVSEVKSSMTGMAVIKDEESPFGGGESLGMELRAKNGVASLRFKEASETRKKKSAIRPVVVGMTPRNLPLWIHSSCENLGIELLREDDARQVKAPARFSGIYCQAKGPLIRIAFFYSSEVKPGKIDFTLSRENGRFYRWVNYRPDWDSPLNVVDISRFDVKVGKATVPLRLVHWRPGRVALKKKLWVNGGLGLTGLHLVDSRIQTKDSMLLTGSLGASYRIHKDWSASLSGYMNLWQVVSTTSTSARFLGVNARVGYRLPVFKDTPWTVSLQAGAYYLQMFVSTPGSSGATFGFSNMIGPQLYPSVTYELPHARRVGGYFKYSPLAFVAGFSLAGAHEFAIGGFYSYPFRWGNILSFHLDVSTLILEFSGPNISISSTSISLGAKYSFGFLKYD